jgi:hypothetical protein
MNLTAESGSANRNAKAWLVANSVGALLFLLLASLWWTEQELRGIPGASGGAPILWALTAVPVLLAFGFANLCALAWACIGRLRRGRWPMAWYALASIPIWVIVVVIDNAQH